MAEKTDRLYYLSFANETEFLGATIVEASSVMDALVQANIHKLNPGGEVAILEVPIECSDMSDVVGMKWRLVEEKEMKEALKSVKLSDLPPHIAKCFVEDLMHELDGDREDRV